MNAYNSETASVEQSRISCNGAVGGGTENMTSTLPAPLNTNIYRDKEDDHYGQARAL